MREDSRLLAKIRVRLPQKFPRVAFPQRFEPRWRRSVNHQHFHASASQHRRHLLRHEGLRRDVRDHAAITELFEEPALRLLERREQIFEVGHFRRDRAPAAQNELQTAGLHEAFDRGAGFEGLVGVPASEVGDFAPSGSQRRGRNYEKMCCVSCCNSEISESNSCEVAYFSLPSLTPTSYCPS